MNKFAGSPIVQYVTTNPCWPMKADVLNQFCMIVERHLAGVSLSAEQIEQIAEAAAKKKTETDQRVYEVVNGAAVIPVSGVIAKYSRLVNGISQPRGTSIETIQKQIATALADDDVKSIMLLIESPGGNIAGLPDLADAIYDANTQKPVIAFADDLAASAAYWLGSQASRFYANQSAEIGSIGVYSVYFDASRLYEDAGVRVLPVASGAHKATGFPGTSISEEQLKPIRAVVNDYYEMFLAHILRGRESRGLGDESLREVADGRTFLAAEAVKLNLIDGVKTFGQAITSALPATTGKTRAAVRPGDPGPNSTDDEIDGIEGEEQMNEETTKEQAAADLEKKTTEAAGAAAADERQRCMAVAEILAGYPDLARKAQQDPDCDATGAKAMLADTLAGENVDLKEKLADAEDRLGAIATAGGKPVLQSPSDEETAPDNKETDKNTYDGRVAELMAAGDKEYRARIEASKEFPEDHEKWLKENDKKVKGRK